MNMYASATNFRSGFVAVMGRPNVGKSTLINTLVGQKVAAVSPRPQTTRSAQLGILTSDDFQIVFVDTPGVHQPRQRLGERMNENAQKSMEQCDMILFMVDASQPPNEEDQLLANLIFKLSLPKPVLMVMNKIDLVNPTQLEEYGASFTRLLPQAESLGISAKRGDHIDTLTRWIVNSLPENPPFFPEEQVTDLFERDLSANLIREAALHLLRDEIPHGIAVRIDQYTERSTGVAYIEATIFVEKESHKGIVIGQGGAMLKEIGSQARREIEAMSGRRVYLQLRVKVRKNWRNDDIALRQLGY